MYNILELYRIPTSFPQWVVICNEKWEEAAVGHDAGNYSNFCSSTVFSAAKATKKEW
jgi:hypothetical protein